MIQLSNPLQSQLIDTFFCMKLKTGKLAFLSKDLDGLKLVDIMCNRDGCMGGGERKEKLMFSCSPLSPGMLKFYMDGVVAGKALS